MDAATQLENLFCVSDKMLGVIYYVFDKLEEITPFMLQKLLYFIQGVSYAVNKNSMFPENCQAWLHGPVYPEVYDMFQDFKYNPAEDVRFAIFNKYENVLTSDERKVIDLGANTFGMYSGKVLEKITHSEKPWLTARIGYGENIPSKEPISMESIKSYYLEKNEIYDFSSEEGLSKYIREILE